MLYEVITAKMVDMIKDFKFIKTLEISEEKPDSSGMNVFPFSQDYNWSRDNFGPLWMPKAGETIDLNMVNIVLYERIITAYEGNSLKVKDGIRNNFV